MCFVVAVLCTVHRIINGLRITNDACSFVYYSNSSCSCGHNVFFPCYTIRFGERMHEMYVKFKE